MTKQNTKQKRQNRTENTHTKTKRQNSAQNTVDILVQAKQVADKTMKRSRSSAIDCWEWLVASLMGLNEYFVRVLCLRRSQERRLSAIPENDDHDLQSAAIEDHATTSSEATTLHAEDLPTVAEDVLDLTIICPESEHSDLIDEEKNK